MKTLMISALAALASLTACAPSQIPTPAQQPHINAMQMAWNGGIQQSATRNNTIRRDLQAIRAAFQTNAITAEEALEQVEAIVGTPVNEAGYELLQGRIEDFTAALDQLEGTNQ